MGLLCFRVWFIWWASLLLIQEMATLVLQVVPGLSSRSGVPHQLRGVLTPKWMLPWIMNQVWVTITIAFRRDLNRFHLCCFWGPAEVPVADFGEEDISTEAEKKRHRRSRSASITRRLVPLARYPSAPIDFSSRERSRALLEQIFNNEIYQLK